MTVEPTVLYVDESHPWAMSLCCCGDRIYPDGWYWTDGVIVDGPFEFESEARYKFRYEDATANGPRV